MSALSEQVLGFFVLLACTVPYSVSVDVTIGTHEDARADTNTSQFLQQLETGLESACPGSALCKAYRDNPTASGCWRVAGAVIHCSQVCSCTAPSCVVNRMCCPFERSEVSNSNPIQLPTKCVSKTITRGRQVGSSLGFRLVSSCPAIGRNGSEDKCENPVQNGLRAQLPVLSLKTGTHYRNEDCARCRSDVDDVVHWYPNVVCRDRATVETGAHWNQTFEAVMTSEDPYCRMEIEPPINIHNHQPQKCYTEILAACNVTGKWENYDPFLEQACATAELPYVFTDDSGIETVFANVFCFRCNGYETPSCQPETDQSDAVLVPALHARLNVLEKPSQWPAIKEHNISTNIDGLQGMGNVDCGSMAFLDPISKLCRPILCPDGSFEAGGRCVPVFSHVTSANVVVQFKLKPWGKHLQGLNRAKKEALMHRVSRLLVEHPTDNEETFTTELLMASENQELEYLFVILLVKIFNPDPGQDVYQSRLFQPKVYNNDIFFNLTTVSVPIFLKLDWAPDIKVESNPLFPNGLAAIDLVDNSVLKKIVLRSGFRGVSSLPPHLSLSALSFCSQVELSSRDILDFKDYIIIRSRKTNVFKFARTSDSNHIRMCLKDYLSPDATPEAAADPAREVITYTAQAILSLVFNVLSMTCLILTILTYLLFAELRSIPGKNNMMLATHLLIAQCLYQFGMDQGEMPTLCVVLGILIHLFWLTAIFWMNACTVHMFRTFVTGQNYRSTRALDPVVCCYAAYSYGMALVLVTINIGTSLYSSGGDNIGYGGVVCYISSPAMIGWLFALPVGVVIVVNLGFFVAVVYQISVSTMNRREKSIDRTNAVIYMKLSSLTGVTWVFGYLYLWTKFAPFEYIFIALNAGQGILIFISFICTARIARLYRGIVKK